MTATSQSVAPMCNLPAIIEAMRRPEMYPDRPRSVEVRQTHVSYAFLAGDYVYKIKKPVRLAFLDACTLARRHQLCVDEVRLNRRLAPDVYLGVVPILRRGGGELALGAESASADEATRGGMTRVGNDLRPVSMGRSRWWPFATA